MDLDGVSSTLFHMSMFIESSGLVDAFSFRGLALKASNKKPRLSAGGLTLVISSRTNTVYLLKMVTFLHFPSRKISNEILLISPIDGRVREEEVVFSMFQPSNFSNCDDHNNFVPESQLNSRLAGAEAEFRNRIGLYSTL